MKKIINKIYEVSAGKCTDTSLLKEVAELKNNNIFWYPSAWMDTEFITKYNRVFVKENNMPEIGLFLHSDYLYYREFIKDITIPYTDYKKRFIIEKIEGYYLLTEQERTNYAYEFNKHYSNEMVCALVDEPDLWIAKIKVAGIEELVTVIFTQLENNYLLQKVIKPYKLRVKYVCTNIEGNAEGGNRTSFLFEPYSAGFQEYIKENDVIWKKGINY